MTDDDLLDALHGLFAYDTGSVDSGIHDELLKQRCKEELRARLGDHEVVPRVLLSADLSERYMSEEALEQGYGIEDVMEFMEWLKNEMGIG